MCLEPKDLELVYQLTTRIWYLKKNNKTKVSFLKFHDLSLNKYIWVSSYGLDMVTNVYHDQVLVWPMCILSGTRCLCYHAQYTMTPGDVVSVGTGGTQRERKR